MRIAVVGATGGLGRHVVPYDVVDDQPVTYAELYRWVAAQTGAPDPPLGGQTLRPSLACSNARIKRELGWSPAYPSFRAGLA